MNSTEEQTAQQLRLLVQRAAPTITAHPQLAKQVLARAATVHRPWDPRHMRRRTKVGVSIIVAASLVGAVAAGSLVGRSDYQKWIQPSIAMNPTVKVSQTVLLGKQLTPGRGDVVLLEANDGRGTYELLSRVIGLPGDTVSCPAEADGTCKAVVVSGQARQEPWLTSRTEPFASVSVPANQLFLLGDARDAARDSRFIGPQRLDSVLGVVIARYNAKGEREALPGAPRHELPDEHQNIDPAGPVPPSGVG